MTEFTLCSLSDIKNPGSKGFRIAEQNLFVVRHQNTVAAYKNICPHMRVNMESVPDQFLTYDKDYILCSLHGAVFTIEEGYCVYGPCSGKRLQTLPVRVIDDMVMVQIADAND